MANYIYSSNQHSEGAANLARHLGIRRVRHTNSTLRGGPRHTIINWGASELPEEVGKCIILNTPSAVSLCSDKVEFFKTVDGGINIPEWTTDREEATDWVKGGKVVFCRKLTRGSGGRGIVQAEEVEQMIDAPLYTKYIPKKNEYRVHIFDGKPFLVQRKGLRGGIHSDDADFRVRNHAGGFIFVRNEDHIPSPKVEEEALKAFNCIKGLTFGSVDVIFNEYRDTAYVLEINTASGLTGSTIEDYGNQFSEVLP